MYLTNLLELVMLSVGDIKKTKPPILSKSKNAPAFLCLPSLDSLEALTSISDQLSSAITKKCSK